MGGITSRAFFKQKGHCVTHPGRGAQVSGSFRIEVSAAPPTQNPDVVAHAGNVQAIPGRCGQGVAGRRCPDGPAPAGLSGSKGILALGLGAPEEGSS